MIIISLLVWLPLTGDYGNLGLLDIGEPSCDQLTVSENGKIGSDCYLGYRFYHIENEFLGNKWSIMTWVKSSVWSSNNNILLDKNISTATENQFYFSIIGGTTLNIGVNGGFQCMTYSGTTFDTDTWYHIGATYDGTTLCLYINGEMVKSETYITDQLQGMTNLGIGGRSNSTAGTSGTGNTTRFFNDVRIYDEALSPLIMKQISQGLILHYPLNNGGFGQENLHLNSDKLTSSSGWNYQQATISNGIATITPTSDADRRIYQMPANGGWTWKANTGYTVSVDARSDNGAKLIFCPYGGNAAKSPQFDITNKWKRYSYSFTTGSSVSTGSMTYSLVQYSNVTLQLKNPKLEEGSIATPWCPNSADSLYSTLGLDDGIEYDVSGYGYNGTKTGAFAYDADTPRYNTSTRFNLTDTRITPPIIFQSGAKIPEISFSFWMKRDDYTDKKTHYIYNDICQIHTYSDYLLRISWKHDTESSSAGNTSASSTAITTPNEWHHICYTFDKGYLRLYIDGEFKYGSDRTDTGQFMGVYNFRSIGYASGSNISYGGCLSDFRIYATALSADDVMALYKNAAYVDSSGNVYAYEFVES